MAVALGEMFICSKLGQNLSEMEIRTFVRIQKVIWDRLLASKAEFIQKLTVFSFSCRKPRDEILSACSAVLFCFSLGLFCSPPRPVFRLNQLKKVRKRCSYSRLNSQAIILDFFGRNVGFVMFVSFGCYGRPLLPLLGQVWELRSQKNSN